MPLKASTLSPFKIQANEFFFQILTRNHICHFGGLPAANWDIFYALSYQFPPPQSPLLKIKLDSPLKLSKVKMTWGFRNSPFQVRNKILHLNFAEKIILIILETLGSCIIPVKESLDGAPKYFQYFQNWMRAYVIWTTIFVVRKFAQKWHKKVTFSN